VSSTVSLARAAGYEDLDKIMWEWFTRARYNNIPVSRRKICMLIPSWLR